HISADYGPCQFIRFHIGQHNSCSRCTNTRNADQVKKHFLFCKVKKAVQNMSIFPDQETGVQYSFIHLLDPGPGVQAYLNFIPYPIYINLNYSGTLMHKISLQVSYHTLRKYG